MADDLAQGHVGLVEKPEMDMEAAAADIAESLNLAPAPAEGEEAPPVAVEPAPVAEPAPAAEPAPVVEPAPAEAATEVGAAPDSWRKEAKAEWAKVPPVVREELVKREADIMRYVEQTKGPASIGQQFERIVGPHMEMFAKANINVFENYVAVLEAQKTLAYGSPQAKMDLIAGLAKNAGITLEGGVLSAPDGAQAAHIHELTQRLNNLEGGVKTVTSRVQEAQIQELSGNILLFLQDTERHPYGMELVEDMTALLQKGFAKSLEEAYQQSVMANPVTRQKAFDAEISKGVLARQTADAARAEAARKAAGANVQSNGARRSAAPVGTVDDTLKETMANINARTH